MKLKTTLFLLLFVSCLSLLASENKQREILLINSYHNGLSWSDSIMNSIKREFRKDINCVLHIEYMDTKRYYSEEYLNSIKTFFSEKYKNKKFDLILSADNNAYDFLQKFRNELFGEVPVVFCGLNTIIETPDGYSGVFENFHFCATINLIKNNHPDYKEVVVISDFSTTGKVVTEGLLEDIAHMKEPLTYRIVQAESMKALQQELSELEEGSIVLYLLYNRENSGKYFTYEQSFEHCYPYCKVPIYCVWDFYLGKGAVGGGIISGRGQGKQASDIAKQVLAGTPIDSIPNQTSQVEYMFDHNQLAKFNIKRKQLPPHSKILNLPFRFVRENKEIFVLILTILVLLTIVIIVMTINIHLRKVREQKDKAHLAEMKITNQKLEKTIVVAEESSHLKSAFLANMSHEIRTPMNAILGFTELLSGKDVSIEKRNRFISIIRKNTNALLRLISDILDISKIETNQIKIEISRCNINNLFESIKDNYERLQELHDDKELNFILTLPEQQEVLEMNTDAIRLQQIFMNLLENSLKFTHEGEIEIGYLLKNKHLEFFVRDTGIGIPEDKQDIIFDRFRQADVEAHTRQYGGTGLGLAICKSLIELLGGEIWMKSKENVGTTFFFTIPL